MTDQSIDAAAKATAVVDAAGNIVASDVDVRREARHAMFDYLVKCAEDARKAWEVAHQTARVASASEAAAWDAYDRAVDAVTAHSRTA